MNNKTGAIELSVGTIVIIVLALTMLILGLVLVRSIMCSAISITSDTGAGAKKEISKIWSANQEEVTCLGSGDPITLTPGKLNVIWCSVRADSTAKYKIELKEITSEDPGKLSNTELKKWVSSTDSFVGTIAPGDESLKKFLRLNIPKDASEASIIITAKVTRDDTVLSDQILDFRISRAGFIKAAIC